ncbi:MAG: cupin domain-containing protein, partial [Planctomycetes bacterium]|nr:cupin domain-containing protein [Planctomycetota bacterium]
ARRVPGATLLDDQHAARTVVTRAAVPDERTDKGYLFRLIAAERADKAMQPFLFTAKRGEITAGGLRHPGQEFVHVLSGTVDYRVGATTWTLAAGDSLYFDSDEEHDVVPVSETATWLAIFHHPPAVANRRQNTDKTEATWARKRPRISRPRS